MTNTNEVRFHINTINTILWCIDPSSGIKENDSDKNNEKKFYKKYYKSYTLSHYLYIFPIAGFCAISNQLLY